MAKKSALRKAIRCVRRFIKQFGWRGIGMSLRYLPLELESPGTAMVALKLPGAGTIRLRNGTSDKDVFFQVFVIREYDFGGVPQFARLKSIYGRALAEGETPLIVDCGANIGLASIWFAHVFPRARIYAIEPDAGNFAVLRANTADYANIVAVRAAVWDRHAANLAILNPAAPASFYQVAESDEARPNGVPAYTIPEIMRMAGAGRILLAKIDIEGAERALFRSNTEWLADTDAVAIELHDWLLPGAGSSRNFLVALARYPFEVAWHHGTMFCVKLPDQEAARPGGSAKASSVEAR
ncbi:MAG: FkbM family methyltransferase [Stellaceae bacterium]